MPEIGYIFDPIEADADALQQEAYDYIQTRWPDWVPNEGNLETWLIAACARMVAEAATVASDVPPSIFRYLGESVMGISPVNPTSAIVDSTWTLLTNPAGRTIEANTLVGIEDEDSNVVLFEVVSPVTLAPGDLVTDAGGVSLRARDEGTGSNSLGGIGIGAINVESIAWVSTILLTGATAGGSNGETDEEYLDRLSAFLTLLTPRPILPKDFELLSKNIARGLGVDVRVVSIDGYNPSDGSFNNERMITLAVILDDTGEDVPADIVDAVDSQLQALREVNFIIYVVGPTRTSVDVAATIVKKAGWDTSVVEADVDAAIRSFLSPANWGDDLDTNEREWNRVAVVRHQDVSTVINNVLGVDYWTALTIGLDGGARIAADQNLTGHAPLATPGTIDIAVS